VALEPDQLDRLKAALADRYVIEQAIGHGGMATVYLAEDRKHERPVAIKVFETELAALLGAERFLNEIKLTANLQHPHILPLHDSGTAAGFLYYVMPYVEGESLRTKLNRETQLAIDEALQLTEGIGSAMDYAHRQGVIHRDLKPENVLLHDGQPIVADFGIALAMRSAGGSRLTQTGISLGTPQYMSPEQAAGDPVVDPRSDVYALGAVLYEMLAGEPPHTGPSAQAVIAKVVAQRPRPIRQLRDTVPPHVEAALDKALAKLPADRFATASALSDAATGRVPVTTWATTPQGAPVAEAGTASRLMTLLPWAIAVVALFVAVWAVKQMGDEPAATVSRSEIALPDTAPVALIGSAPLATPRPALAVSPDGLHIVYVGEWRGETHLYVRPLDVYESRPLEGTRGAYHPFFSPDGQWIGFFVGNELRKVALLGGPAVTLATTPNPHGATWISDERIVVSANEGRNLAVVDAAGGGIETINVRGGRQSSWPEALPGGNAVLVSGTAPEDMAVVVLATGESRLLGSRGWNPRYLEGEYLVYIGGGGLWAAEFDRDELEVVGQPVPLPDPVSGWGIAHAGVSADGMLVYAPGGYTAAWGFVWWHPDGTTEWLGLPLEPYGVFALSPDTDRLAYTLGDESGPNLWVTDLRRGSVERLTVDGAQFPSWRPDGGAVAYSDWRRGPTVRAVLLGGRTIELMFDVPNPTVINGRWSNDGRRLAFEEIDPDSSWNVWVAERTDRWQLHRVAGSRFGEWGGAISPDGNWVAYTSDETGDYQVYVQPFPPTGERYSISTEVGSEEPVWSRDGTALYYRNGRRFWRVRLRTTPSWAAGVPVSRRLHQHRRSLLRCGSRRQRPAGRRPGGAWGQASAARRDELGGGGRAARAGGESVELLGGDALGAEEAGDVLETCASRNARRATSCRSAVAAGSGAGYPRPRSARARRGVGRAPSVRRPLGRGACPSTRRRDRDRGGHRAVPVVPLGGVV
jgi:serine/threonine-protein kinase